MMDHIKDINIRVVERLITPKELKANYPCNSEQASFVMETREEIRNIILGKDKRLLLIMGPCSVHDKVSIVEYAGLLAEFREKMKDQFCIVMRVYFEKPRTTIGWKGLINDPNMDSSGNIELGLKQAREILIEILGKRIPAATEFLDPIIPQYTADLVSWAAIGARTTESQTHREMSSGLSMPVGFKNSTDGNSRVAMDAMKSALYPHYFLGIDQDGQICRVSTKGNPCGHIILRGGSDKPNYDPDTIIAVAKQLELLKLPSGVVVDCSHANADKKFEQQVYVWNNLIEQILSGQKNIIGMMVESNLFEGNQKLDDPKQLKYGISITDPCISFATTAEILENAYKKLSSRKN